MKISDNKILKILIEENYISPEDADIASKYSNEKNIPLYNALTDNEIINKDLLGQAVAEHYKIEYYDLNSNPIAKDKILKLPERIARKYDLLLIDEKEREILLTTDFPDNIKDAEIEIQQLFPGKRGVYHYSLSEDIESELKNYKQSLETRFTKIIQEKNKVAPELINEIISDAIHLLASDIHFEPQENEVTIRFRIDGVLQEAGKISKELFENIINRIKVLAHLRIDEHYSSQDGAIRFSNNETTVDLRISIIPTLDGEKIVIRILSEYIRELSLADLGLSEEDQKLLETAYKKTFGMILTTGPTGSGKTTTLYSVLKRLQNPGINITTIEDPVEYRIPGINQIQVNNQTNLTFAKGLRSIVRQDPNVILVGEIRDGETAEIAVNAALTGHLLLSTFHANDAATAIPRLIDMGSEPFLLASTINLIISQRLARRICLGCRYSIILEHKDYKRAIPDIKRFFPKDKFTSYEGKGCEVCNGTGYKGRIAVYEMIYMTPEMQELILKNPSSQEIRELANSQGARTFFEDGIEKVKNGTTSLDELLRVAPVNLKAKELYG